jgi:hypothetical protein
MTYGGDGLEIGGDGWKAGSSSAKAVEKELAGGSR